MTSPKPAPAALYPEDDFEVAASQDRAAEALLEIVQQRAGIRVLEALALLRRQARLGNFEAREALWTLVGDQRIELTPERTLRLWQN